MQISLGVLSKYRTEIMGFAAILIILCHANVAGVITPNLIHFLLGLGNVGVDIFLFVSGIGMYYSLSKCQWGGLFSWYKKRYTRILFPYLIITLPWWIYYSITRGFSFCHFIREVLTLNYWVEHYGAWYVALLIPLYFITPNIARIIESASTDSKRWSIVFLFCVGIILATSLDFDLLNNTVSAIIDNVQLAFSRVPLFIIGYGLAPYVKNEIKSTYYGYLHSRLYY